MRRNLFALAILVAVLTGSSALGVPLAYEGFDYPNDSSMLDGKAGGTGWTGPWTSMASPFGLSQDDVSLDAPVFPFDPVGDRVFSPEGSTGIGFRSFGGIDMSQDGNVLYASFLMKKDGSSVVGTAGNNLEFDLGPDGSTTTIRLGSTSGNVFFLNLAANTAGTVVLGETNFLVLKITSNAATPDLVQASFYSPNQTVPVAEPTTWALTHSPNSNATFNTARVWAGAAATGALDEIRLGTTWADVTAFNPAFVQGDFNNSGALDLGDFNILAANLFSGTTYAQGDFDSNGAVDLRDFVSFRTKYNAAGLSLSAELVPEPASASLLLLVMAISSLHYRRRGTR